MSQEGFKAKTKTVITITWTNRCDECEEQTHAIEKDVFVCVSCGRKQDKYYTLLIKEESDGEQWSVAFGDFEEEQVKNELEECYSDVKDWVILCSSEQQEEIDAGIDALNRAYLLPDLVCSQISEVHNETDRA